MHRIMRPLAVVGAVLLVPVIPVLLLMETSFEQMLVDQLYRPWPVIATWSIVVGLLSIDILLPVPSSVISTYSGSQLGWCWGTLANWIGMCLGSIVAFAIARRWGHPIAVWLSGRDALERMHRTSDALAPYVLAVFRAVPVLAEASVLLFGIHRVAWRRFLPVLLLSNLGISLAYAAFGDYATRHQWLAWALGLSVAVPALLFVTMRRMVPRP